MDTGLAPERLMLVLLIDESQRHVNGVVRVELYKGNGIILGRSSRTDSLFDVEFSTFEEDSG